MLTLKMSIDCSQFLRRAVECRCGLKHRFFVDKEIYESMIPRKVLRMIHSSVPTKPTVVLIHGVTGHRLMLLVESIIPVRLQLKCIFISFLISDDNHSVLGVNALYPLDHPILLQATSDQLPIPRLFTHCWSNKVGMIIDPAILKADGDPMFLYGQQGVLKAINKFLSLGDSDCGADKKYWTVAWHLW